MHKRIAAPAIITAAVAALLGIGALVAYTAYQHADEVRGIETGTYQMA